MTNSDEVMGAAKIITKTVMQEFEEVRVGGSCNMFDMRCVQFIADDNGYHELASLTKGEYVLCIKFYSELMELHGIERMREMRYWKGMMKWPLDADWVCETCGEDAGLTWGLVHAHCRCNWCHTQYKMRESINNDPVTVPICMLKEEYKGPARKAWEALRIPIDLLTNIQWQEFGVERDKE